MEDFKDGEEDEEEELEEVEERLFVTIVEDQTLCARLLESGMAVMLLLYSV